MEPDEAAQGGPGRPRLLQEAASSAETAQEGLMQWPDGGEEPWGPWAHPTLHPTPASSTPIPPTEVGAFRSRVRGLHDQPPAAG